MQLVFLKPGQAFGGSGADACLAVLVVYEGQTASGRNCVQLLRDEEVDLAIVFFQRGQAVGVPTDIKRRAQRIVACRHGSEVGYTLAPPFPRRKRLLFWLKRVITRFCI